MNKNRFSRFLLLSFFMAVGLLAITACTRPAATATQNTASTPQSSAITPLSPSEIIIARASQGILNTNSYKLDRFITDTESTRSDNSDQSTLEIYSNLALNRSAGQMQMNNSFYVMSSGNNVVDSSVYVMDGILYMKGIFSNDPLAWGKTTLPADYLQNQDQTAQLVDLLRSSNITILNPETITVDNSNVVCDVLQVVPDLSKFFAVFASQPGIQLPTGEPPVAFDKFINQAQLAVWLSHDSGVPVRAQMEMSLLFDPGLWPSFKSRVTMDMTIQMSFSHYGQQPVIELPDEAKNAMELNSLQKVTPTP